MSETVILSKPAATAASTPTTRQRPKSKESSMSVSSTDSMATNAPTGNKGCCSVGETQAVAAAALVMMKDSRRLVKDLMALLAIREATKDTIDDGTTTGEGEAVINGCVPLVKNRPGANDGAGDRVIALRTVGGVPGARVTAVAAAVASLLHHTATKEFSSLAGEMIAIADDGDGDGDGNGREKVKAVRGSEGHTNADEDDPMLPATLHADADATDSCTNTNVEVECNRSVSEPTEITKVEKEGDEQRSSGMEVDVMTNPAEGSFLSGPVPAHTPRSGTPLPRSVASPSAFALQPCYECCMPPATTFLPNTELTLEQKLDKLLDSVVKIKADMHRRIDRLGRRVEQIHLDVQLNIDSTDRALLGNDLLLIGIPALERENLQQRFRYVCRALDYAEKDIPQVDIRRQRATADARRRNSQPHGHKSASRDRNVKAMDAAHDQQEPHSSAPIVVQFMFKTLRDQFYRAYQAKRVLRLSDIGFASDQRFFVNEVLTRHNQKLMAEAVRRKRSGQIHSVYTVDGIVYVQRTAGEKGTKVTSFASMN